MKRSKRLDVVLRLYQRREDQAAELVARARAELESHEAQLQQLQDYQADYERGAQTPDQGGVTMAQWKRLQDYIEQLDGIIRQQTRQVGLAQVELERVQVLWQNAHLERRSMESAIERISRLEQVEAARKEQKLLDEMIQQQQRRKLN
ncbi:MAG: flagellar export protein FliJ [Natronospirillum sp.]|uniref:flagellar export protein FliJ n=1 Tax=Natronospirillum sp. TaxID=2812955 RepID=UPI0025EC148D|nr:flagellar export protein FliJ [Natronospirillum sp.]MCH8551276.1 flagellar export protein FliJ [Natronospirillum sp.]